jgi:hypothetical protein
MAFLSHKDVVEKILTEIKLISGEFGVKAEEVRYQDFPFSDTPKPGVAVCPLEEREGESTSETSDIGYPVQVMRIYTKTGSNDLTYGLGFRARWRQSIFNRFNRVRLGFPGVCELPCRARFDNYQAKEAWDKVNIDASTVVVTVWIRQPHNG